MLQIKTSSLRPKAGGRVRCTSTDYRTGNRYKTPPWLEEINCFFAWFVVEATESDPSPSNNRQKPHLQRAGTANRDPAALTTVSRQHSTTVIVKFFETPVLSAHQSQPPS
ncbi:hypothetical protein NHX12_025302 [Muraenolepis orangiensis]|uniref:Uncharacterized protein n=1 Tax=Muraenolepis orangiensis TaxID=630683 RepID=A0A9Q0EMJ7_9TELE|nr:hypothetical protein NHX12_025302 [Muraenolepis orangiensis]